MEITYFKFENLPAGLRSIPAIRESKVAFKVGDKALSDLMAPHAGNDELRPVMSGINADENGFTITDAFTVLHIPATVPEAQQGLYAKDWKTKIDDRYPNYMAVVPTKNTKLFTIDLLRLDSYLAAADHYSNKTTHQLLLTASLEERWFIGVNGNLLRKCLRTMRQLGYEHADLHASDPNRAMVLTPVGKQPLEAATMLIMPVIILQETSLAGAIDPDFGIGLGSIYDLRTNSVENMDGTTTDTWTVQEGWQPSGNVDRKRLAVIRSVVKKNNILPILDYVLVQNRVLKCSDLETFYNMENCGLADGWYLPEPEGLVPTMIREEPSDFPHRDILQTSTVLQWPVADLADRLDIAMVLKGNDDIRKQFSQQCIEVSNGRLSFTVTDAHGLYRDECAAPEYVKDFKILPTDVKSQKAFCNIWDAGTIDMRINGTTQTVLKNGGDTLIIRNLDERYPDVLLTLKKGSHTSEKAIIVDRKEVDTLVGLLKGVGHIRVANDGALHIVKVEDKKLVKVRDAELRTANLPQPRKKLMIYMPTGATAEGYKAYGFGENLFVTLKKLYTGRGASEFTLHYSNEITKADNVPHITVSNPTLPDWPDDHVLGTTTGGNATVVVTPGPAKPQQEAKQLEIVKKELPPIANADYLDYAKAIKPSYDISEYQYNQFLAQLKDHLPYQRKVLADLAAEIAQRHPDYEFEESKYISFSNPSLKHYYTIKFREKGTKSLFLPLFIVCVEGKFSRESSYANAMQFDGLKKPYYNIYLYPEERGYGKNHNESIKGDFTPDTTAKQILERLSEKQNWYFELLGEPKKQAPAKQPNPMALAIAMAEADRDRIMILKRKG